jgi:DNA-binding beta-propeller fold protein YncE
VSVIDGTANTVTAAIPVGTEPIGVGVDPATHTAYAANFDDSTVSVLSFIAPDMDLALSQPANITTYSTRPKGATVTYPLPTVTDEDAPTPAPICSPAPGTVFPYRTTTVTCSVTDADDSPSTVTVTFTITVLHGHPRP